MATDDALDLALLADQLRRHTEDLSLYGGFLLNALSAALPADLVWVRREGKLKARLAGREPAVLGLTVSLGHQLFELDRADVAARPVTRIGHQSGGVVMSRAVVPPAQWSAALAAALAGYAGSTAAGVDALKRLTAQ